MAALSFTGSVTASSAFAGGVTGVNGRGPTTRVVFSGTWATNDTYVLNLIAPAATYVLGTGNVTNVTPAACMTYGKRVHFLAGQRWYFSDNNDATGWESQAPGAGYITLSNQYSAPENLVSIAPYQGKVAITSLTTAQIWNVSADPTQFSLTQVLANIGCYANLGMQPIGDLDVLFPHTSGIRSLRVRDSSLNAMVTDIGSAVDTYVAADTAGKSLSVLSKACAIVEPTQNRYWVYIPADGIYVLSYFPSNKIVAWSKYTPTTQIGSAQIGFTPTKFVVYNGQVYAVASYVSGANTYNAVFVYGGSDNRTYDNVAATMQLPYYDEKRPGHKKYAQKIDVDVIGTWQAQGSPNWVTGSFGSGDTIGSPQQATFDNGWVGYEDVGSHFSFVLQSVSYSSVTANVTSPPSVNALIFYYQMGEEP
jgi:hypothetical protein